MHRQLVYVVGLIFVAVTSSVVTRVYLDSAVSDGAVYLIGAVTITDAKRLPEYRAIAEPLAAQRGGYVPLAFSEPTMLEGEPPSEGLYFIERYDSMSGLKAFIESEEFQEARIMRDKVANVHFMLAIDAYRHE